MFKYPILTREQVLAMYANDEPFVNVSLYRVDLSYTNLTGIHLKGVDLAWANLEGANLTMAYLEGANFEHTHLGKSDAN